MYELILSEKSLTLLATVLLAVMASSLAGVRGLWLRGLVFSLTPAMASAFYLIAFLLQQHANSTDLIAGLIFEVTTLIIFYRIFAKVKSATNSIQKSDSELVLKWSLLLQITVSLPNLLTADFGLFSTGSRIGYLYTGSLPKYFTYAGILIVMVQAAFLAALITSRGRLGSVGWSVVVINLGLSILAGSKGGVFLWLLSVASLIDYKRAGINIYKILLVLMFSIGAVLMSSLIISDFLGLEMSEFFELALNRFFLVNDARALALDLRTSQGEDFSLFAEAFRSLSNVFGSGPQNEALGIVLYNQAFAVTNGNGANTSFMALVTYYFPQGYSMLPAMLGILGILFVCVLTHASSLIAEGPIRRLIITSIWFTSLLSYSQDFLAFQVLMSLVILTTLIIFISRLKFYAASTRLQPQEQ